jgi:CSLREA domain-containing protein
VTIRHNYIGGNEGRGMEIAAGTAPVPPSITSAESPTADEFKVEGTVEGTPGETVELDFFGSSTCGNGEGRTFLGTASVPVEAGPTAFSSTTPVEVPADDTAITSTQTSEAGGTSEFSACADYVAPPQTFPVTTLEDPLQDGACGTTCSLRDAIEAANATPAKDTIDFAVVGTIEPEVFTLPAIEAPVTIDGTSAPGYAGTPLVELDGSAVNASGIDGLVTRTGGSGTTISGLAIGGFENGILFEGTDNQVCGSYLGVEIDGTTALANQDGVETWSGSEGDRIGAGCGAMGGGNLIAANSDFGILDRGAETRIAGNRIGVDAAGDPLANGGGSDRGGGIEESLEASGGMIGRVGGEAANVIEANEGPGISVSRSTSAIEIRGNSIFGNTGLGIEIETEPPTAPTVDGVVVADGTLTFEGQATAGPSEEGIELDFFANESCDPSGAGEGQTYLGTFEQNSLGGATPYETDALPGTIPAGQYYITATSTGTAVGQTSEFSECFHYMPPGETFVVNTTADSEDDECGETCSLRDAIEAANELPNRDLIEFEAGAEGTIALGAEELPPLVEPVTIDGTLAPGWAPGSGPRVTIDGTATSSEGSTHGLAVEAGAQGSAISGLAIENFDLGVVVVANHVSFDWDRIANNRGAGVQVIGSAPETSIRRTTLFADGGGSIEFETPNAVPEPEVESFAAGPDSTVYDVPIEGVPGHEYAIDVFADAHCEKPGEFGPAEVLLGSGSETVGESGEALVEVHGGPLTGINAENFTATATDLATGTTSQIGHCARTQPETEIESGPTGVTPSTSATLT